MKKILLLFMIIIPLCAESYSEQLKIKIFEPISINGTKQWVLIRGNDESKPVLLYLHGGPGQSLIPFAYKATDKLVNDFIVVYWDQRGTGLSYDENISDKTMTINQFVEDTRSVTEYLKKKFKKEKIYLLGHSWGTVLGTLVIQKYSENYYAYIGVGQVVNSAEQERDGTKWLKKKLLREGTQNEINQIRYMEESNFTNRQLLMKYGGMIHNITINELKDIMNNSPYSPETYTNDIYNKGLWFAINLHRELRSVNFFKTVSEVKIPVYFFLGAYDYVTPTEPTIQYFKMLKCPKKALVIFEKSGHRMDIEEPHKFQTEIINVLKK
jgi:pimeloyl-ACP methyl ester carboxylesterase